MKCGRSGDNRCISIFHIHVFVMDINLYKEKRTMFLCLPILVYTLHSAWKWVWVVNVSWVDIWCRLLEMFVEQVDENSSSSQQGPLCRETIFTLVQSYKCLFYDCKKVAYISKRLQSVKAEELSKTKAGS